MTDTTAPLYTAAEKYLDAVEKGQRAVVELIERSVTRLQDLTPDQVSAAFAKVAPKVAVKPEDLEHGYALVNRAVAIQQSFARELVKVFAGSEAPAAA